MESYKSPNFNFYGKTLIITGVDDPDNYNLVKYGNNSKTGELDIVGGYCYKIIVDLQYLLNFTMKQITSDLYLQEVNGSLGGIGRQVLDGEADLTIPLSYFLPFRVKYLTALVPLLREPMLAIFHPPPSVSIRDIYIGTLSPNLWIALGVIWFTFLVIFLMTAYNDSKNFIDDGECFLIIVGAISEQGWYKRGGKISAVILSFIAFLFGYIILESFKATIISELALDRELIKSFEDLFTHKFRILTNPVQQWGRYLAPDGRNPEEFMRELASYYIDDEDSAHKTMKGRHAFLGTWDYFVPLSRKLGYEDQLLCSHIDSVTVGKMATYSGFYVARNSSVKEAFNYGIIRILEHGLHAKHYENFLAESTLKCLLADFEKTAYSFGELGIGDVITGFSLMVSGLLLSVVILCMEKVYSEIKWARISRLQF